MGKLGYFHQQKKRIRRNALILQIELISVPKGTVGSVVAVETVAHHRIHSVAVDGIAKHGHHSSGSVVDVGEIES